ncbi:MAG: hypothetical protein ACRYG8_10270 [Janthinobacterium lividum]
MSAISQAAAAVAAVLAHAPGGDWLDDVIHDRRIDDRTLEDARRALDNSRGGWHLSRREAEALRLATLALNALWALANEGERVAAVVLGQRQDRTRKARSGSET